MNITLDLVAVLGAGVTLVVGLVIGFIKYALAREVTRSDSDRTKIEEKLKAHSARIDRKVDQSEWQGVVNRLSEDTRTVLDEVRRGEVKRDAQVQGLHNRMNEIQTNSAAMHVEIVKEMAKHLAK